MNSATYLITGGTGFLGSHLTKHLLTQGHKVRVYARSEHGHERLSQLIPQEQRPRLSTLLGAVEDLGRLRIALRGVDHVIHAAAQKIVPIAEYDPGRCVATNVDGTANVIDACLSLGVRSAVLVSSDKAAAPYTVYGATKLCAERLWLAANRYSAGGFPAFMACRYGNVWGSKGSVLETWAGEQEAGKPISITYPNCTRWHITVEQAIKVVLEALHEHEAGDLVIPKMPRYTLGHLAEAFGGPSKVVGLRLAEKKHEDLISEHESCSVKTQDDACFVLRPGELHEEGGWSYRSSAATARALSVDELRKAVEIWRNAR